MLIQKLWFFRYNQYYGVSFYGFNLSNSLKASIWSFELFQFSDYFLSNMILQCITIYLYEKSQSGYDVSTGSGQTLQQTPKIPGSWSAKIMRNQVTGPIVAYLLLLYLPLCYTVIFTLGESVLIEPSWLELLLLEILPPPVRAWFMKSDSVKLIFDWWIGESKLWWICELSLGVFFLVCPKNGCRLIVEISSILNNRKSNVKEFR